MTALTQCVEGTLLFQKERDWKKHFDLVTIHKIMKTCNKITSSLMRFERVLIWDE